MGLTGELLIEALEKYGIVYTDSDGNVCCAKYDDVDLREDLDKVVSYILWSIEE